MAHGMTEAKKPTLHQALHGYADGHRQLALSAKLKPRDLKTLLAVSDISGPGVRLDEAGYLTGYPLTDSGVFALARTWPAPEMHRPGCVWTHTLLVDFNDLAVLDTLTGLSEAFKRPSGSSDFQGYGIPIRLDVALHPRSWSLDEPWIRQVLAALYGRPRSRIVATRSTSEVDNTVLALWSQQWPRLRRGFRFCTFAANDRSVEGTSFDLQVLPHDHGVRSRFTKVVDAAIVETSASEWLDDALKDLVRPDAHGLRSFFRLVGSDVSVGREAFRPLCQLHHAVAAFTTDPKAIHEAIRVLDSELWKTQARMARAVVAKAALEQVETLDAHSFDFLWANLPLVESGVMGPLAARIGRSSWQRNPKRLAELVGNESGLAIVVDRTLTELDINELIQGLRKVPELIGAALTHRREIVGHPSFWKDLDAPEAALQVAGIGCLQSAAMAAILASGRDDLASSAVKEFGARIILQALSAAPQTTIHHVTTWVQAAAHDTAAVADFLANQTNVPRSILYALARTLPPDAVPNDYGSDPWLNAFRSSTGSIDESATFYLAAYLLSRALGSRSRSEAELVQISFEATHTAAASNRLPDESWRLLESRLPWSVLWFDWDRCHRLRMGVTALFLDRDLSPHVFAHLVQNEQLFLMLINGAARTSLGRRYLERVRIAMQREGSVALHARIRSVEKLLG